MEAQGYSKAPRRLRQSGQSTSASELSLRWGFHSFFFAQKGAPKNAGTQCSGSGGNTVLGRCEHTDGATELLLKQEGVEVVGEVHRGGQIAVEVREVHVHGPLVEEACRGGGEGRDSLTQGCTRFLQISVHLRSVRSHALVSFFLGIERLEHMCTRHDIASIVEQQLHVDILG